MPSFEYSSEHEAFVKKCVTCKEIFIGTADQDRSFAIFREDFGVSGASNSDGLYTSCNLCVASQVQGYRITRKEKRELYERQNGKCPICQQDLPFEKAVIDHNHSTGVVRGLLHTPCNSQLGFYEKYLSNIRRYLEAVDEDN